MVTNKDIKQWEPLVYKIVNRFRKYKFEYKTYIDWSEVEQIGMIALYKAIRNYNPDFGVPFKNYASTAIVRSILRHEKFEHEIENHIDIDTLFNAVNPIEDNIDFNIDIDITRDKLIKIINRLPITEKNKQILLLRLKGYELQEIADMLGCSMQAVSSAIYRQVDKLKELLEATNVNGRQRTKLD